MQKIIVILVLAILSFSCKQEPKGFSINTSIEGLKDGTKVYLKLNKERKITTIDSTIVKNGKFSFNGTIKEPVVFGIFMDSIRDGIFPFIGKHDQVKILVHKDSLRDAIITGSAVNVELDEMKAKSKVIELEGKALNASYLVAKKANDTATINNIKKEFGKLRDRTLMQDWAFIKSHPNSYLTPMIFEKLMASPKYKDSIKPVFLGFSEEIQNSDLAKKIRDYINFLDKKKKEVKTPSLDKK